jgi:hypothetical protein
MVVKPPVKAEPADNVKAIYVFYFIYFCYILIFIYYYIYYWICCLVW